MLSWFTSHADRSMALTWAGEEAAVDLPINFHANRALAGEMNAWPDEYVAGFAATISASVTFIHGDGDPRPVSAVRDLAAHIPHHTFHLLPSAGHSPWREQPELVREVSRRRCGRQTSDSEIYSQFRANLRKVFVMTAVTLDPRRWWALGAMSVSLLVVGLDPDVLNVVLPTWLATKLQSVDQPSCSGSANAYTHVLAALLLPAGLLGDLVPAEVVAVGALVGSGGRVGLALRPRRRWKLIAFRVRSASGALPIRSRCRCSTCCSRQGSAPARRDWVMAVARHLLLGPVLGGPGRWTTTGGNRGFLIDVPLVAVAVAVVCHPGDTRSPDRPDRETGTCSSAAGPGAR